MIGIAVLGLIVWGHHMFQSGMNPMLGMTFMLSTMVIARAVGDQDLQLARHAVGRAASSSRRRCCSRSASCRCSSSAACRASSWPSTPVDIFIHDTYFIVAHFHYVLFGGQHVRRLRGHLLLVPEDVRPDDERDARARSTSGSRSISFNVTFFPMHILGIAGHMRRIYDPMQYEFLKPCSTGTCSSRSARCSWARPSSSSSSTSSGASCARQAREQQPVAREHARVAGALAAAARQLPGPAADGVPGALRVLLAARQRGLPARRRVASSRRQRQRRRTEAMSDSAGAPASGLRAATPWRIADVRGRAADYLALTKPRVVVMVLLTTLVGFYLGFGRHGAHPAAPPYALRDSPGRWRHAGAQPVSRARSRRPHGAHTPPSPARRAPGAHRGTAPGPRPAGGRSRLPRGRRERAGRRGHQRHRRQLPPDLHAAQAGDVAVLARRCRPRCVCPPWPAGSRLAEASASRPWSCSRSCTCGRSPTPWRSGRLYRVDYARAGIRVLPAIEGEGLNTAAQSVLNCLALLSVTLLPTLLGMAGSLYFVTALRAGRRASCGRPSGSRVPAPRSPRAGYSSCRSSICRCFSAMMAVDKVHIAP